MSVGSGGTQRQDQQFSPAQNQMQELINQYAYNAYHNSNRPDFQSSTQLYAPSGGERDVMGSWQKMLQGAQNWSPYNSGNNPYQSTATSGMGGFGGETRGPTDYGALQGTGGQSPPGTLGFGGETRGPTDYTSLGGSNPSSQSTYGGNNANLPEGMGGISGSGGGGGSTNNPAEEWYKRMQGAIGAGSQMPNLQGPDIRGMGPLQGPDIQGPDIREMGPLTQAPTPEAAIEAAKKNLNTITAPGLAQQAAATGGSMDSGAYLEALANAGTAASVPISQQQLAMQGQFGMQGNELMSQQNQQANAIRGQYGLQGNDIRGQFGLQGNDIANQQNQQGNQIRAGYGLQANDLAGSLAQGRQNQLYGLEMAAPGMGATLSANNLAFENQRNQGLMGLAGTDREGQLQDYLRQQNYLQGAMGLLPTGAFSNPATNSRMQSSPGLMESLLGFTQAGKNIGQGMGASMGKSQGGGGGASSLGTLMALA